MSLSSSMGSINASASLRIASIHADWLVQSAQFSSPRVLSARDSIVRLIECAWVARIVAVVNLKICLIFVNLAAKSRPFERFPDRDAADLALRKQKFEADRHAGPEEVRAACGRPEHQAVLGQALERGQTEEHLL